MALTMLERNLCVWLRLAEIMTVLDPVLLIPALINGWTGEGWSLSHQPFKLAIWASFWS